MKKTNEQIAMRVSSRNLACNIILGGFKLFAGIFGRSAAMVSDAVNTLSDVLSTVVVMIGVKLANKKADKDHPYGHERFECVASIILSVFIFATGAGIGWAGIRNIMTSDFADLTVPGMLALTAAIGSIVVKEGMYWYTRNAAKKIDSGVLMADAWHHRSDVLSSVGSFVGILGAKLGYPILDSVASLVICVFIIKAAFNIFMNAVGKMTDKAIDEKTENEMRAVILSNKSVAAVDLLNTRIFGDRIFVEVEISVDGSSTLHKAHDIAQNVHDIIETAFPKVKHCAVHVNPC